MRQRLKSWAAVGGCVAVAGWGLCLPLPNAAAQMDSAAEKTQDIQTWLGARGPERANLDLIAAEPFAVDQDLKLTFRVHNPTDEAMEDLQLTSRRGDAVEDTAQARTQLATGEFPYYGPSTTTAPLQPGESREVNFQVPTSLHGEQTLAIEEPGAYPLLFTLTGTVGGEAVSFAEERLVGQVKGKKPALGDAPSDPKPHDLSVVYPISADIDLVPGGTGGEDLILSSDELASELAEGGRLDRLVSTYADHDLRGAACVAIDPALLDTVSRMAEGYKVGSARPVSYTHLRAHET